MIPIQIIQSNQINGKPGEYCNGFNGNLNSWEYGLKDEVKQKLIKEYSTIGQLAQFDTVNSPYYTQVQVDPNYIKYLHYITTCNQNKIK